jgi:hypothetical protein
MDISGAEGVDILIAKYGGLVIINFGKSFENMVVGGAQILQHVTSLTLTRSLI